MKNNLRSAIPLILLALALLMLMSAEVNAFQPSSGPLPSPPQAGKFRVQVLRGDVWVEAGNLACDRFFKAQQLDLSPYLTGPERAHVRLTQTGGNAAHIDAVLLGDAPPVMVQGADDPLALKKVANKDLDVLDAHARTLDFTFPANADEKTLNLAARIEPSKVSETPFQFPRHNLFRPMNEHAAFYSYQPERRPVDSDDYSPHFAPFELRFGESLASLFGGDSHQIPEKPLFKEYCITGSGHPSGYTYGWVSNDDKNLYVKLDFTPDNTSGNKDYAIVWVKTENGLKPFRVSQAETTWGRSEYTYTDMAPYQHKTYQFEIPLKELGIAYQKQEGNLLLAFSAYGSASPRKAGFTAGGNHSMAIRDDGTLWAWGLNSSGQLGDGGTTDRWGPVTVVGSEWEAVSAGGAHTLALKADGTLWAWGENTNGQIGNNGGGTDVTSPTQIGSDTEWVLVSAGGNHSLALKANGELWAWGSNGNGQVGNGGGPDVASPTSIDSDPYFVAVSAGGNHSLALKADGTLWAWGSNDHGQLGDPTIIDGASPVQIGFDTDWVAISAGGNHSLALKADGTLWTWGANDFGQLGDTLTTDVPIPQPIGADTNWVTVSAGGNHSLALKANGELWAWGDNSGGQLGDGTTTERHAPVQTVDAYNYYSYQSFNLLAVTAFAAGGSHSLAQTSDSNLWAWGADTHGQLGGLEPLWPFPLPIGSDADWTRIAAGDDYSLALKSNGSLWAWGDNPYGQLGDGTTTDRVSPVQIGTGWAAVSASYDHSLGIKTDGTLWAWGNGGYGKLGTGNTAHQHSPVRIGYETSWTAVSAGHYHSLGIGTGGTLWAWGQNYYGSLGDGTTTQRLVPVQIGVGTNWAAIAAGSNHSLGIKTDGTLWAWGYNANGQLGDGTTTQRLAPVQIGAETNWAVVSAGSGYSLGIKTDGTLWAWGSNNYGTLGDGTRVKSLTPMQIGTGWAAVSAGLFHSLGVKTDGTLWAWGYNQYGELGDYTTTMRLAPVQIGTGWAAVAAGVFHSLGIKGDGTLSAWGRNGGYLGYARARTYPNRISYTLCDLYGRERYGRTGLAARAGGDHTVVLLPSIFELWAWGDNTNGQLGTSNTTEIHTPGGVYRKFLKASGGAAYTLAIDPDGLLWAWGSNGSGQLGDDTTTDRTSPVNIGSSSNWTELSAGEAHSLGLQSDGTLWAWGSNSLGQLGDGTTTNHHVPSQVGYENNWASASAGNTHSLAMQADGTLWAWGDNAHGQLGNGSTAPSSTPVQITGQLDGDNHWMAVSAGTYYSVALKSDGTLWAWGANSSGQLGNGSTNSSSVPVQITGQLNGDNQWVAVAAAVPPGAHTVALKADGTLWTWGDNAYGQLAENPTTIRETAPVQVGADTDWVEVSPGSYHTVALKADGTMWSWGNNSHGQLGDDTTTNKHVPTQPGTVFYVDRDWDNYGDPSTTHLFAFPTPYPLAPSCNYSYEYNGEHYTLGEDCDDTDPSIYPGAPELCDGKDHNCDTVADDGCSRYYQDADGDGFGDPNVWILFNGGVQPPPPPYVASSDDCNDGNFEINPNTVWYKDADGDHFSDGNTIVQCQQPPTGYMLASEPFFSVSGDCDDGNFEINPNTNWYGDADNDGYSNGSFVMQCQRPPGYKLDSELLSHNTDCNDADAAVTDTPQDWFKDDDNDGFSSGETSNQCDRPFGLLLPYKLASELTATTGDDDDGNPLIHPVAQADQDALVALYNSSTGTGWANNSNWLGTPGTECTWYGVTCTGNRVTELALANNNLAGSLPSEMGNLTALQRLELDQNQLSGGIPSQLGNLTALQYLSLQINQLSGGIPSQLGSLANLEVLNLSFNQLSGSIPSQLGGLTALQQLSLDGNQLSGGIPSQLGNLGALYYLALNNNQLSESIPAELGNLSALQYLGLNTNQLSGSIPVDIGLLTALQSIELIGNRLSGTIPPEIGDLTALTQLRVAGNMLTGPIPTELTGLTQLNAFDSDFRWNVLYSTDNGLTAFLNSKQVGGDWESTQTVAPGGLMFVSSDAGSVSMNWVPIAYTGDTGGYQVWANGAFLDTTPDKTTGNYTATGLTGNHYNFSVRTVTNPHLPENNNTVYSDFTPSISVTRYFHDYDGDGYGDPGDSVLAWSQPDGYSYNNLDTDDTNIDIHPTAAIPPAELEALIALYYSTRGDGWDRKDNWLGDAGTECTWYGVSCSGGRVTQLELESNNLSGNLPAQIGNLTALVHLELLTNQLTGSIPAELGNLSALQYLGLHNNQLSGSIPTQIGSLTALHWIALSYNQLSGSIPAEIGNLTALQAIDLYRNQLSGSIPAQIANLSALESLDLCNNQLSGSIPVTIGNLTALQILRLGTNQLSGSIPAQIGSLSALQDLYLDGNQLSGSIPTDIGYLSTLRVLCLRGNQLSGSIPAELGNLTGLEELSLAGNQLSGSIPAELGNLTGLVRLVLDGNKLSGPIPTTLINLTLLDAAGSDFRWNALYTSNDTLRAFLNTKQMSGNWENTQTVAPTNVALVSASGNSATLSWTPIAYTQDPGGFQVWNGGTMLGDTAGTTGKSATGLTVNGVTGNNPGLTVRTMTNPHSSNSNTVLSGFTPSLSVTSYYRDADGDHYGNPDNSTLGISQPTGYVANNFDCDDANPNIYPGVGGCRELLAKYPFNGNANDKSGNDNNGTVFDGVTLTTDRFGNAGSAYSFDGGTDSYITVPASDSLVGMKELTIAAWIYPSGLNNNYEEILGKPNNDILFYIYRGAGKNQLYSLINDAFALTSGDDTVRENEWQHVVFTWKGGSSSNTAQFYINGVPITSIPTGSPQTEVNISSQPLILGNYAPGSVEAFNGKIDDIYLYNYALSAAEVQGLYADGHPLHLISGTILDGSTPLPGVTVTLSGTQSQTTTTDENGTYAFQVLLDGSYTITPSEYSYTFSPSSRNVVMNGANVTGKDFAGTGYDLVAKYLFNGNANDTSGRGNHGTVPTGVTLTPDRFTNANSAYSFDGVPEHYISVPHSDSLVGMEELTLSAWIYPSGLINHWQTFLCKGSNDYLFSVYNVNGRHQLSACITSYLCVTSADGTIHENEWQHVVFTWKGTAPQNDFTLYLNGVIVGSRVDAGPGSIDNSGSPLIIGNWGNPNNEAFNGKIDDIYIYNRALSGIEVQNLYNNGQSPLYISGTVLNGTTPIPGVTMTLSGTRSGITTTGPDGTYSFDVLLDGSYTITPSKPNHTFTPPSRTVNMSSMNSPGQDFGGSGSDLAELASFTAKATQNGVTLKWKTLSELDNAGFHLWRSETRDGEYKKITTSLISAEGGATYGAVYTYKDHQVTSGKTYYYRLEDIDTKGVSTYHGPVSTTMGSIAVVHPKNRGELPANPPSTFHWLGDGVDRYRLQFSKHPDFKSGFIALPRLAQKKADPWVGSSCITDQSYAPSPKEWKTIRDLGRNGETIYFRVHGKTASGKSVYSKVTGFRFEAGQKTK